MSSKRLIQPLKYYQRQSKLSLLGFILSITIMVFGAGFILFLGLSQLYINFQLYQADIRATARVTKLLPYRDSDGNVSKEATIVFNDRQGKTITIEDFSHAPKTVNAEFTVLYLEHDPAGTARAYSRKALLDIPLMMLLFGLAIMLPALNELPKVAYALLLLPSLPPTAESQILKNKSRFIQTVDYYTDLHPRELGAATFAYTGFIFLLLIVVGIACWSLYSSYRLYNYGHKVVAEVTDYKPYRTLDGEKKAFTTFTFTAHDGKEISITEKETIKRSVGEKLTMFYYADDPKGTAEIWLIGEKVVLPLCMLALAPFFIILIGLEVIKMLAAGMLLPVSWAEAITPASAHPIRRTHGNQPSIAELKKRQFLLEQQQQQNQPNDSTRRPPSRGRQRPTSNSRDRRR